MSGGQDQGVRNDQIGRGLQHEEDAAGRFDKHNQLDLSESRDRATSLYNQQLAAYTALGKQNGGEDPYGSTIPGGGGGGGGGSSSARGSSGVRGANDDPRFAENENNYRNFLSTGGWNPADAASVDRDVASLQELGANGGFTDEMLGRARGNGVFDEFSRTGGYTDTDKTNIRSRATSVIPAQYAAMRAEADRAKVAQGGYGPGAMALKARMARAQQSGLSDAARDAEISISDKVNAGREWGSSAASSAELGIADTMGRNKIGSLAAAGNLTTNKASSMMQGKMFGTQGLDNMTQADRNALLQREQMANAAAIAGAGRGQQDAQFNAMMQFNRQNASASGLTSLYGSVPAEYFANKNFDLQNRGMLNQTSLSAGNLILGNNPNVNHDQLYGSLANAGISAATNYYGGKGGNVNVGSPTTPDPGAPASPQYPVGDFRASSLYGPNNPNAPQRYYA